MKLVITVAAFLLIALPGGAQATPPAATKQGETNGLRVENPRRDLPLQIAGATFGDQLRVILVNLTSRTVKEVTVGVLLEDETAPAPVTRVGKVCKTNLAQGGLLFVDGAQTAFPDVDAYFRNKGMTKRSVSVGITHVRFADGTEWNLPIETAGRFERAEDPDVGKKLKETPIGELAVLDPPRNVGTCRGAPRPAAIH